MVAVFTDKLNFRHSLTGLAITLALFLLTAYFETTFGELTNSYHSIGLYGIISALLLFFTLQIEKKRKVRARFLN